MLWNCFLHMMCLAMTLLTYLYMNIYRYKKHGVLFEFYDAMHKIDPTTLMRKGKVGGGVRDYHWTAAITFRMLLQLEELGA